MSHPPIGIDLGTTNSLIAAFIDGKPQLLANALGGLMTPSAVAFQDDQLLVGQAAWDLGLAHPELVATAFKRKIGTDLRMPLGGHLLSAPELSAFVLKKMKSDAEAVLGETIDEAVISVPAYFNQVQREATRTAARLAGINPLSLVNEPTAAALAYGLQDREGESQFLVFDLGGGTFDVTVLEHFEGVMEVKASAGDGHLGGEDFTTVIQHILFQKLGRNNAEASPQVATRLRYFAEQAKRKLSEDTPYRFTFDLEGETHEIAIGPEEFEAAAAPLLRRLRRPLHLCIYEADGRAREIERVVLVGGATRMPMARKLVAQELKLFPDSSINPDHAVALGAAIHAALLKEDRALEDVVMTDVSPFSIGTEVTTGPEGAEVHGLFSPIVERNTPLPASREERYFARDIHAKAIDISLYQGESVHAADNIFLGKLEVKIPPDPERTTQPGMTVRITQDISGLIEVSAQADGAAHPVSMIIQTNESKMDEAEIKKRMKQLDHLKIHPRNIEENKAILNRLDRLYQMTSGEDRDQIRAMVQDFESVLSGQDTKRIAAKRDALKIALAQIDSFYVS